MRFKVLKAAIMKVVVVFWDVASSRLAEVCRRIRGACCLHYRGDVLVALVNCCQTKRPNLPEDSRFYELFVRSRKKKMRGGKP
jgi:hypothetical protein